MNLDDCRIRNDSLRNRVTLHSETYGATLIASSLESVDYLTHWIHYLNQSISKDHARPILMAAQSSIVESIACVALGLVRPALFSMRVQIELLISWIYFNDHRVEWETVIRAAERYPLYSQNKKYLSNYGRRFSQRFNILKDNKLRSMDDPYEILSIHVHSLTVPAMPKITDLEAIVESEGKSLECTKLQMDTAEYLTDALASWYADNWADFPEKLMNGITSRLSEAKRKEFFG